MDERRRARFKSVVHTVGMIAVKHLIIYIYARGCDSNRGVYTVQCTVYSVQRRTSFKDGVGSLYNNERGPLGKGACLGAKGVNRSIKGSNYMSREYNSVCMCMCVCLCMYVRMRRILCVRARLCVGWKF